MIATIVEQFSAHWIKSNSEPIVDADAAYVISYAVIMLNTDQHNKNHNNTPMTAEQFKRNLRGTNGGKDHDQVLELVSKELNNFGVIADLFRQIGGHSSRFVLFCSS